jgi:hypothetical protein
MKLQITVLLMAFLLLFSCQDNKELRLIENVKDAKKKEIIFNNINKGWNFNANPINPAAQGLVTMWPEWRGFLLELNSKPKSTNTTKSSNSSNNVTTIDTIPKNTTLDLDIDRKSVV